MNPDDPLDPPLDPPASTDHFRHPHTSATDRDHDLTAVAGSLVW